MIKTQPMIHWSKNNDITQMEEDQFSFRISIKMEHEEILFNWIKDICAFRLQFHFARKSNAVEMIN